MKKVLFTLVVAFITLSGYAQGRYCSSYEDYASGKWIDLPKLELVQHSFSRQLWVGGNDFKFKSGDKATDKILKKEAFVIEYQDTMYVNLRNLRYGKSKFGSGYARCIPFKSDVPTIFFVARHIGGDVDGKLFASGFFLGAIGGAIAGAEAVKDRVCYLIDQGSSTSKIDIIMINDNVMQTLLRDDAQMLELYKQPKSKKKRFSAAHILPILREKGFIEYKD